ncbi:hypothetical protein TRFO_07139 [Tritrichomonas foetus]|uniref:Palmitoyltransferase n=1 Tax=Tritrichomonas foetus TaxID=1144522 RepID=A0A1J4JT71_9EUKA|nr:hypothetical protein TRFO_07139 [Tritrichomonas foetus]|eukprot:OHT02321.1 hypothetical protein TRFO_07139 [Tritrichomonas foetus]
MRPIGERTHRFFLLFLISCIIVSGYVSFGCFMHLSWRINSVKDRMSWSPSKLDNYLRIVKILMNHESMVSGTFVVLALIAIVLFIFVLQQCFYISFNILQIEQEKYEYIQEQRKLKGIKEPVVNHYNQGFWKNWLVFLFPPKVERHTPMTYRIVKKKEEGANKEGKNEDKQEEKGNITEEKGDKKEGKKKIE